MMQLEFYGNRAVRCGMITWLILGCLQGTGLFADEPQNKKWIQATAYAIPKETAPEGEGYFAIVEGHNGRLYIGTHANAVNSWLVEFDPKEKRMQPVVDVHRAIGKDLKGFGAQAKIHTRNNVGASGKIYFATKQGYPTKEEKFTDYPGGYPLVYDPATGKTRVYPIPFAHQGIISITPDESRGIAYVSTCSDSRPLDSSHFGILDLETGKFRDLMDCQHMYAFIVVDYFGRAYHPIAGGDIARYDPRSEKLERLKQTMDGMPPASDSHLADPETHPINWDIAPDGKTLYAVPMSTNQLYSYDLTGTGDALPGRSLGPLVSASPLAGDGLDEGSNAKAKDKPKPIQTDCRALCVGPTGEVWAAVTQAAPPGIELLHLVSFRPGDKAPRDRGPVAIRNPDYTEFTNKEGKPLPFHGGIYRTPQGITTTRTVTMGVCQSRNGSVYVLALGPYTLLEIPPDQVK